MRKLLLLSTLIIFGICQIKAQSWVSSNKISSTESFVQLSSKLTSNGEILSFGYFQGTLSSAGGKQVTSYGESDYYIIKFLQDGSVDWMQNFGSVLNDFNSGGIAIDGEENIYISGGFQGFFKYSSTDSIESSGGYDLFIVKLDELGNSLWARNAGTGASFQVSTELEVDNSGDLLITGFFIDSINIYSETTLYAENPIYDFFYSKFEPSNGDLLWVKQGKSLNNGFGRLESIKAESESYLFAGRFQDSIGFENDTLVSFNEKSDVQLINTDLDGTIQWIRKISGAGDEFSYSLAQDDQENIYISGYYGSDTLYVESSNEEIIPFTGNNGKFDLFVAKYLNTGELAWVRTSGGIDDDKIFYSEFFDDKIYVTGYFSDTLLWGGIKLATNGPNDIDMFTGALDAEGNYRDANKYSGRFNSDDQGRGLFKSGDNLYTIMRSNTDLIVLGDSIYTSDGIAFNMYIGVIGCQNISVDNVIVTDITTCYGDSTGAIQVIATGGFGSPWQYSIDNGNTYQPDISYFDSLPAGDYPVVVIDKEGCAQPGPTVTVNQPDTLTIEVLAAQDVTDFQDGVIQVVAYGGTKPYLFTLQPDGIERGSGTYNFSIGDTGVYYVEVTDLRNCGPAATDSIEMNYNPDSTSVNPTNAPELRVYPNPTSGPFTLEMPVGVDEFTIEVLSLAGQVVHSHRAYSTGGMIIEVLDVSHLSKGMYMLRVNGKTLRSGVVVN